MKIFTQYMLKDSLYLLITLLATILLLPLIVAITALAFGIMFIPCCIAFTIMSFKTLQEYIKPV